jgi:hypothetical protein
MPSFSRRGASGDAPLDIASPCIAVPLFVEPPFIAELFIELLFIMELFIELFIAPLFIVELFMAWSFAIDDAGAGLVAAIVGPVSAMSRPSAQSERIMQ